MAPKRDITPVRIPGRWAGSGVVERVEGTRQYIEHGSPPHFRQWLGELHATMAKSSGGLLVPLKWVPVVVGVSREAVNKRVQAGGLTVFSYVLTEYKRKLFRGYRIQDSKKRYDLVPFAECEEWRDIRFEEADRAYREQQ